MMRGHSSIRAFWPLGALSVASTVLAVGWFTEPDRFVLGSAPQQPIAFSHRLHAGSLKMACLYCHSGAARSRAAGIPSVETCMGCHTVTREDAPDIRKLTRIFQSQGTLAWKRVYQLPDHVYFDHRPHVLAGVACETCHGDVRTLNVVSRETSLRMSNCLACHRHPQGALPRGSPLTRASDQCTACHR